MGIFFLQIEVTGSRQLVTKVAVKLNCFSIVNIRIFSNTLIINLCDSTDCILSIRRMG